MPIVLSIGIGAAVVHTLTIMGIAIIRIASSELRNKGILDVHNVQAATDVKGVRTDNSSKQVDAISKYAKLSLDERKTYAHVLVPIT